MSARLSAGQQATLSEMGIDVWLERGSSDLVADIEPAAIDAVPDAAVTNSLIDLNKEILTCKRCDLHQSRTQAVCGVGNLQAELLVLGVAPNADEDRQGEPFIGQSGQLLNGMLKAIGIERDAVFITNVLKCRPAEDRSPQTLEVESCAPFLQQQLELVKPKLILVVGQVAAQSLLGVATPIAQLRGEVHSFGAQQLPVIVTHAPESLLNNPLQKRESWSDLQLALGELANLQG